MPRSLCVGRPDWAVEDLYSFTHQALSIFPLRSTRTEQKTEIRDRVERLKADRAKAEQTKATPAAPVKAEPKRTSKAKTPTSKPTVSGTTVKKAPAKV